MRLITLYLFTARIFFVQGDGILPLPLFLNPPSARKLLLLIGQAQLVDKVKLKFDQLKTVDIEDEQFRCTALIKLFILALYLWEQT